MKRGFTVVELMVVLVVLVVLATLAALGYRSAQDDGRDTARRAAVQQIVQAVDTLRIRSDEPLKVGGYRTSVLNPGSDGLCPYNSTTNFTSSTGSNWVYYEGTSTYYSCTLGKMLILTGLLPVDFFDRLPDRDDGYIKTAAMVRSTSMALYSCDASPATSTRWILYYYLKNPTPEESASIDTLWDSCAMSSPTKAALTGSASGQLGMKAAVEIKL